MIGKVKFQHDGKPAEAVLADDGRWECNVGAVGSLLNSLHSLADYSPADGAKGHKQLHEAAQRLHGTVRIEQRQSPPPNAIFR